MDIRIPLPGFENTFLSGELVIGEASKSLIIFAHGSGSGRVSSRNQHVANVLNSNGFATFLVDLLTKDEQESDIKSQKILDRYPNLLLNKFNIKLLATRLEEATSWLLKNVREVKDLTIGYFGSSTGAAAAFEASVNLDGMVFAIVSRGGRPDLAGDNCLKNIKASTLLIIGSKDSKAVIDLNRKAFRQLRNTKSKEIVTIPDAGHLFEEAGAIELVSKETIRWFKHSV